MIIHSLKLKNYKKYKDAFIEFPVELFGIVGNNGAGKTSLIEAIAWAIYGNMGTRAGKDLLKREGADSDSDCSVELEFTLDSQAYRVVRALRGKNGTPYAALYVDNEDHTEGVTAVTKYLSRKLGMDHNSFFTSIFAKQKELDALSNLSPGARRKIILKLLRIDSIDTAVKKLRDDKKIRQINVEILKERLQDIQEPEEKLAGLKDREAKQNEKIFSMRNDVGEAKVKNERLKESLTQQEKDHEKYLHFKTELRINKNTKDTETENIEKYEDELNTLVPMSKELDEIQPQLESLETTRAEKERLEKLRDKFHEKSGLESQITGIDERVGGLEKERSRIMDRLKESKMLEKQIEEVEARIEEYDVKSRDDARKLERQRTHLTGLEERKAKLSREFVEIGKLGVRSKCPICKKIIGDDLHQINEHYRNEIAGLDDEIETCTSAITELNNTYGKSMCLLEDKKQEKNKLDESIRQKTEYNSMKNSLDTQIKSENEQRKEIQAKIVSIGDVIYDEAKYEMTKESLERLEELDRTRISLEGKISHIPSVEESIKSSNVRLSESETNIGRIRDDMESLGFNEEDHRAAKSEYDRTNEHYHKMEVGLAEEEGVLNMIKQEIAQHNEQIEDMGRRWKEMAAIEDEINILNTLDDIFKRFRAELISRIIPSLSALSSELFKKITEEKYQKMTLNEDYEILIEDGGKQLPLRRFSGGEEDLASLCLRIAISHIIRERTGSEGMNFIVLDEIFGSQDGARKNNILKALREMSSQFRQIIVITHIDDVKDMLPYVLNIVENPDGTSRIVEEGMSESSLG